MKKKIKYTIFGHKGFLGSNLVKYLKNSNCDVYSPSRNKVKFDKNLNNVIYCIGSDNILEDPINAIQSNLKILCKIIINNKFKSFIYISSTRLYLNSKNTKESDLIKINTSSKNYFYNSLKIAAENFCLSQKNQNIKVVRLSNLYGLNFKKQIYLLPSLIRESKKNKKINIFINKQSKKNYLNINDAINLMIKIANKSKHRLYNIASDRRLTIERIASIIKKVTKCKINYSNQNERLDEPKIDITRIKKEFRFKPTNNFDDFIYDIVKKYKW